VILKINSHYSLYTINMLVFLIDTDCVLCQVGPNLHTYVRAFVRACVRFLFLPDARACTHTHTSMYKMYIRIYLFVSSYFSNQKDKRAKQANFEIKQCFPEIRSIGRYST